jgi:Cu(I)/Ag(I) efflux system membrane fusion protein/cobalt-zinc-cadmium efflux system membrane fusion protein
MYANIYLQSTFAEDSLVIPQEAVVDSGVRKIVFVALGEGKFQPREVRLGVEGNHDEYQVLNGLQEGEKIVLSAQFMLDSESRLREAIQKMLEARKGGATGDLNPGVAGESQDPGDDLDMSGMTMDTQENDLDMTGLNMEDETRASPNQQ